MREYGKDPAMGSRIGLEVELREDPAGVGLDGARADVELLRDPLVGVALGKEGEDLSFLRREPVHRIGATRGVEHDPNNLRVDRRLAIGDPMSCIDQLLGSGDALLQQVTDTAAALAQQLDGVTSLHELREHQNTDVRVLALQRDRCLQAFGRRGRRHSHVGDDQVGSQLVHGREQPRRVRQLSDDLDAYLGQKSRDALAYEGGIVNKDYTHGWATTMNRAGGHCLNSLKATVL